MGRQGAARKSGSLRGRLAGIKLFAVEHLAGAGLAGAAARRHPGARLELLEDILESEEEHIDFLETQLELIDRVGLPNYCQSQMKAPS